MLRSLIVFTVAALICSCAKPPQMEMDAAQYMVNRARDKQAMEYAPTEYQAADTALSDARRAMDKADYRGARESLDYALIHARRAVELAEEGQAKRAAEEAERAKEQESANKAAQLKAREAEPTAKKPAPTPPPKPTPKPQQKATPATSYSVKEGETLWTISAQSQVYGDGLLWPLLYQANRDQIKDPRQIFPGQVLNIRRDMTEKDLEEARQKARESDIFPLTGADTSKQ
jgi:nucleoid-associated protein YgaU